MWKLQKLKKDSELLLHLLLSVYMSFHSDIILLPFFSVFLLTSYSRCNDDAVLL